jgi:hypothetical protein
MSTINTRRGTLKTDETEVPADSATSSRRKNKEEQPPLDRPVEYLEDEPNIADMLQVCCQNLTIIRDFLLGCKENLHRRQACLLACDTMQNIMQKAQRHAVETTVTPALTQEIKNIVENAIASSLPAIKTSPTQQAVPTFSSILKTSTQTNATSLQAPAAAPAPKYKVIVKPAQNCKGVKTSLDTKKILTSKTPRELGIQAERIVLCRDTSVRIESRCPSILKLGESAELRKLKLTAQPTTKTWPKIQIFDIRDTLTQEQVIEILTEQNMPDTVPETFTRKLFKHGAKHGPGLTSWVVEIHPAARLHLMKTARIFSSWTSHRIRDFVTVTRCYLCQGFGHIAKHCASNKFCGYCASTDHESRNCRHKDDASQHKCVNCLRFSMKENSHHTASNECPIYKNRLNNIINETQYDIEES